MSRLSPSFNSGAFRFALVVAALFATGSLGIMLVIERSVSSYEREAWQSGLRSETVILLRERFAGGLIDAIGRRQTPTIEEQFRYLLLSPQGARLAGDMPLTAAHLGWGSVRFVDDAPPPGEEGVAETLHTLGTRLADGTLLVVGTDTYDIWKLRDRLHDLEIGLASVVALLALIGGYYTGVVFLRRLERVNQSVGRIMGGSLTERLPPIGMAPEFDRLSANLNAMLDRMTELMDGLRQVSTDIAHDLRTPLTRLRQILETMHETDRIEQLREGTDAALAQTDDIMAMFRALLRIGLLEGGDARGSFEAVDLGDIAERVVQIYRPAAEDGARRIVTALAPAWAMADRELLAQLLANLIDNALKHTPAGTTITVTVEATGETSSVSVADDGPGITESERPKVLRRFYRVDASRNRPGVGLGLAMVQAIASFHRAALSLHDNGPGLIVRVEFDAPRDDARPLQQNRSGPGSRWRAAGGRLIRSTDASLASNPTAPPGEASTYS